MRRPRHKISPLVFVLFFLTILIFPQTATFTGKVVGVSDGNTISVMRGAKAVKVRLHGIDYPEKRQPFGTRAKQFMSDMAFGKEVTVRIQVGPRICYKR